jgi:hypothetical protein
MSDNVKISTGPSMLMKNWISVLLQDDLKSEDDSAWGLAIGDAVSILLVGFCMLKNYVCTLLLAVYS